MPSIAVPFFLILTLALKAHSDCDILIDAGHGGADFGTRNLSVSEKALTLEYTLQLQRHLAQQSKISVHLSRQEDSYLKPLERKRHAEQLNCRLFLSLHMNSNLDAQLSGTEIYFGQPSSPPLISSLTQIDYANIVASLRADLWHQRSQSIANWLKAQLSTQLLDRPVKVGRLPIQVLNQEDRPSLLIEVGYLSNTQDASLIQSPAFINRFTSTLSSALIELFRDHSVKLK